MDDQALRAARYLFAAAAAAARAGDEMSGPALLLLGVAATGAATTGSALLAGITAAAAVGGPAVGVLLDRASRPGRLLAAILGVYAAGLAAVALLLDRVPFAPVVALALGIGLLGPALSGGWTAQLPRVLAPERLARANAWDAMTFSTASLVGPALAGVVAAWAGAPAAVVASVVLIAFAVPAAWTLPAQVHRPDPSPVLGELAAGARAVVGNRALLRVTLASTVSIAGTGMLVVSTPLLGERLLGGAERGAMLLSVMAASALLANLVLARRPLRTRPETLVLVCVLVQAAGVGGVLLAPSGPWLVLAVAVVGAAEGPSSPACSRSGTGRRPNGCAVRCSPRPRA
ncbi:MFS transporter [Nocardiopsis oceani]